ncbi:MAG: hypothetical protein ACFCD0_26695 [Gemmataceae bacterium]
MKSIFLYEWKHLLRSPFKLVALLLFVVAAVYGLHNGASLYYRQMTEIEGIQEKVRKVHQTNLSYYDKGLKGPEDRRKVDLADPAWALFSMTIYHVKQPSPAMVYSIGQAEQYGYYKQIRQNATPYDDDMAEEIANPERLQYNPLDYAFVILYLQPLLLLILLCNLKSAEAEQGLLPLIEVQAASGSSWLMARMAFYLSVVLILNLGLLFYGAMLTGVLRVSVQGFGEMLLYSLLYLLVWSAIGYVIMSRGKTIMGNTLQMAGMWLLLAFIIPATVHRTVSIRKPVNLMTDFIDARREDKYAIYGLPEAEQEAQINALFPGVIDSPVAEDSTKRAWALRWSRFALAGELAKSRIASIESENDAKNRLIRASYWFNPINFFQNQFNSISQTHYDDYQQYRDEIQSLLDKQHRLTVLETWRDVEVDKEKYLEYFDALSTP